MAISIGSTRQLFLDDRIVEETRELRRRLHRPARWSDHPVLRADRSWEEGGSGVALDREAYKRSVEFWSAHANWRG